MVPPNNKPSDPVADPALWNDVWVSWQDPPEVMVVDGRQLLREAFMATVILVSVVALVTAVLRLSSPLGVIFKIPTSTEARVKKMDVPHMQAEKATLTFNSQNY